MEEFSPLEPELERRPPVSARQWLMPSGRFTIGSAARLLAVAWVALLLLATPPALVLASKQLAGRADQLKAASASTPSAAADARSPEDLRALSGLLIAGATAVAALGLVLGAQLAWRGFLSLREGRGPVRDAAPRGRGGG